MMPKVSFVIPCYKLGHLLQECVHSILSQGFEDFEVLILDDCSPDDTPRVAQSFGDSRVKHVRNSSNLGHLANYNKGISLARGEYIWLVSADDRLRTPQALEQYVRMMEAHPKMGFVCCPGVELCNGGEKAVLPYSVVAHRDTAFKGHDFLQTLLNSDVVIASSGMVRRECYEQLGAFPLDMPYAGDWYMWCLFALYYDVGYIAEPLVNYRGHDLSMTNQLKNKAMRILVDDELTVLWRIKKLAEQAGHPMIVNSSGKAIIRQYARYITGGNYLKFQMNVNELDESLKRFAPGNVGADGIRDRVFASAADLYFAQRRFGPAAEFYELALRENPWSIKTRSKLNFLRIVSTGPIGVAVLELTLGLRRLLRACKGHL
jgi:glycosyltransferase involved in cell wall biosynthesis